MCNNQCSTTVDSSPPKTNLKYLFLNRKSQGNFHHVAKKILNTLEYSSLENGNPLNKFKPNTPLEISFSNIHSPPTLIKNTYATCIHAINYLCGKGGTNYCGEEPSKSAHVRGKCAFLPLLALEISGYI